MALGIGTFLAWLRSRQQARLTRIAERTVREEFPRIEPPEDDTITPVTPPPAVSIRPPGINPELRYSVTEEVQTWTTPPAGQEYEEAFRAAESLYGLPRGLLSRVAFQESGYNPNARSPAGAVGLMQIIPRWHPEAIPEDPYHSINYAARYLHTLRGRFGTWEKALAAYNWGQGNLSRAIEERGDNWKSALPGETSNYIAKITRDVPATRIA